MWSIWNFPLWFQYFILQKGYENGQAYQPDDVIVISYMYQTFTHNLQGNEQWSEGELLLESWELRVKYQQYIAVPSDIC